MSFNDLKMHQIIHHFDVSGSLGCDKFSCIFLGEFDTPEAIWSSEMRFVPEA